MKVQKLEGPEEGSVNDTAMIIRAIEVQTIALMAGLKIVATACAENAPLAKAAAEAFATIEKAYQGKEGA